MISIQQEDFDLAHELQQLRKSCNQMGAFVSFVGLVRDYATQGQVTAIELEYYPAMTYKSLVRIVQQAELRWPLLGLRVIHRIGYLPAHAQIVLVAVASQHRHSAFAACEFIMDYLKTEAPFWKKEYINGQNYWVEAKATDTQALAKWQN
ncbi:molybdenum cofactor biosynthesis protein MoaE [Agitococcus lubricus]|uniref:Molybdopterin synthase catalytic subunit n=1 Tax=Agitococcus lubricus TaxID=1077255 RepID=A0A2T5IYV5_9GAMM|nr:molybdenum cofactor biosynthesis protein MoaE [Agitococcus lubricus]PTQ89192.1 molybdopterin synthase subunit MoaE [Agitococcus lubricus]